MKEEMGKGIQKQSKDWKETYSMLRSFASVSLSGLVLRKNTFEPFGDQCFHFQKYPRYLPT